MSSDTRRCELCSSAAVVYCPSDSAYLCGRCDSTVHSANFLVARHLRSPLCRSDQSSSLSSICTSMTTESSAAGEVSSAMRRRRRKKRRTTTNTREEGILVNWCNRLGLDGETAGSVVATADRVFRRLTRAPVRVGLATSFWVGMRLCGMATCQELVRVERISGVPAKVILGVEGRIGRVLRTRRGMATTTECGDEDYKEGWAEC